MHLFACYTFLKVKKKRKELCLFSVEFGRKACFSFRQGQILCPRLQWRDITYRSQSSEVFPNHGKNRPFPAQPFHFYCLGTKLGSSSKCQMVVVTLCHIDKAVLTSSLPDLYGNRRCRWKCVWSRGAIFLCGVLMSKSRMIFILSLRNVITGYLEDSVGRAYDS